MLRSTRTALAGVALVAAAALSLTACSSAAPAPAESEGTAAADDVTIRIGAQPVFALAQWWAADQLGYLEENGVNIELAEILQIGCA